MSDMNSYRLSQVGDIVTGTTPSTKDEKYWGGNIPFYSPADFNGDVYCCNTERTITEKGLVFGRSIPENSIMVTCIGSIGKIGVNGAAGLTNQQINTLIPSQNFDHEYVYYLILNNIEKLINSAPQTTIPILNKKEFGKFSFDFHKFSEQQKIATILQTIDQTIEKTEALIEKYQQIKAGLMHDLFTRGITADGKLRPPREQAPELYQETLIGWIPKDWGYRILQDLVNPSRPICYGILMPGYGYEGGIPVIKVKDIKDRNINVNNLLLTSPSIDAEYSRSRLKSNDILLTIRGTVGRICMVPNELENANITQDTARIDLVHSDNNFYSWYFETDIAIRHFSINTLGVAVQGINLSEVRKTPVITPPANEQIKIAEIVTNHMNKVEAEKEFLSKLKKQKLGLMHDLLTGKVSVEIAKDEVLNA